jgi:hypothetical protein
LPENVYSVGRRGWLDIFYKNDFYINDDKENVISIYYDIDDKNVTGELDSSGNYLNINPLGLNITIKPNEIKNVRIGYSLDGFLR